ncbi:unnamed protein product [Phytophthora lilii]|uniref:Unnamed protein product n=1 Tax=Phytophthora lilii TaxID=2077276 RepID=A0A9W6X7V1_9STRA|nr:unnamed protein product [Phytophthora lilii]
MSGAVSTPPLPTVTTVKELEKAVADVFEWALTNDRYCDVYASMCAKLEAACAKQDIVSVTEFRGVFYCCLDSLPPSKVTGPFPSKVAVRYDSKAVTKDVPHDLVAVTLIFSRGDLFRLWQQKN